MEYDQIVSFISSVGFPIFVAVWLLWRSDRIVRELRDAILELKKCIEVRDKTN